MEQYAALYRMGLSFLCRQPSIRPVPRLAVRNPAPRRSDLNLSVISDNIVTRPVKEPPKARVQSVAGQATRHTPASLTLAHR